MARKFFYVCAGLFLLVGAYAMGVRNAGAQASGVSMIAIAGDGNYDVWQAVAANGNVYRSQRNHGAKWSYVGNVFGGPTPAEPESLGQVKQKYH